MVSPFAWLNEQNMMEKGIKFCEFLSKMQFELDEGCKILGITLNSFNKFNIA
jgi:hypothetical protein